MTTSELKLNIDAKLIPDEKTLAIAKSKIDNADLQQVADRLDRVDHWKPYEITESIKQYRNFLYLKKKYGKIFDLPPSVCIDEVWHAHILHTEDYVNFCDDVYGEFLHHHPHHGKNQEITDEAMAKMFAEQTQIIYQQEFGKPLYQVYGLPWYKRVLRSIAIKHQAI